MGRLIRLIGALAALLVVTGCENALQDYLTTNLFGLPYHLQVEKLSVEGAVDFGFSVDIDGDYVIIGAPAEDDNTAHPEAAYVYYRTGTDTWDDGFKLNPSDGVPGDNFGYTVSLNGDYAAVGAPKKTVSGQPSAGAVYIFKRTETNTWVQEAKLTQADSWSTLEGFNAADHALFGSAVDLEGNWLFIAARQDDLGNAVNDNYGAVYTFKHSTTWDYDDQLTAGLYEQAGATFGWSIHAGGDYVAVGAGGEEIGGGNKVGAVYLFQFLVDGWEQDTRITAPDGEAGDGFGLSVAVSNDYLAVGAPQKTVGGSDFSGKVYLYQRESSGGWDTVPTGLTPETPGENDFFGFPVALKEDTVMVGSLFRDDAAADGGAVFLYTNEPENGWVLEETLTASDAAAGVYFGRSIAIGETYAVIGATHTYEYHPTGAAYLYR